MPQPTRMQGERALAAQRAGRGAPPPPPAGSGPGAEVAAAATLAVATGAAAAVAAAPSSQTATAAGSLVATILGGLLQAFDRFTLERRSELRALVVEVTGRVEGAMTPREVQDLADAEDARELTFAAKSRERMVRDLPAALAAHPEVRRAAVHALLERERRFARQREAAIIERATADAENAAVRRVSPDGAYWHLDPYVDNCWRCRAMAGKVWPWSVLATVHPPLHMHCACKLYHPDEAIQRGWIARRDLESGLAFADFDHVPVEIREARGVSYVVEDLDLMEARFDEVYGRGHEHPLPTEAVAEGVRVEYSASIPGVPPAPGVVPAPVEHPPAPPAEPTTEQVSAAISAAGVRRPTSRNGRVQLNRWFAYEPRAPHVMRDTADPAVLLLPPSYFKRPTRAREFVAMAHVEQLAREERSRG